MLHYLKQQSELTLFEGIKELRAFEGENENNLESKTTEQFKNSLEGHDVIHSLFGCSTDVLGEIKVHLWMMFATTTKMSEIKNALGSKDHKTTLKEIGHFNLIKRWFIAIPIAIKIYRRSKKMHKKYPVENFKSNLDQKLKDLRKEYNINII